MLLDFGFGVQLNHFTSVTEESVRNCRLWSFCLFRCLRNFAKGSH